MSNQTQGSGKRRRPSLGNNVANIIEVPAIGVVVLAILVVVLVMLVLVIVTLVVVIKQRRGYLNTKPDIPLSGTGEASRAAHSDTPEYNYSFLQPISATVHENQVTRNDVPHYEEIDDARLNINSARTASRYQNVI